MRAKLWSLVGALMLSFGPMMADEGKLKQPEPSIPTQAAVGVGEENEIPPFETAPGFQATLWADERLLVNPVAISFDERGRLYVAETHRLGASALDINDHPDLVDRDLASQTMSDHTTFLGKQFRDELPKLEAESERVRRVEDTNGDGRADDSRVIADGLNAAVSGIVGGILAENGRVLVAHSPDVWQLPSTSEKRPVVAQGFLHGFGVHVGSAQHGVHGPILGPDGMLYFSVGDRGMDVLRQDGTRLSVPDSGAIVKCSSDGSRLEIVATGFINPGDLAFDDWGNLFVADAASGNGDEPRWMYVLEGSDGGWRTGYRNPPLGKASPWLELGLWKPEFSGQPAYVWAPVMNIAHGPRGLAFQPGGEPGSNRRGTFFLSHFGESRSDSGVRAYTLEPRGTGFAVARTTSVVRGALATDVAFGPDGRLYFSDWGARWPWPKAGTGRIYALDASEVTAAERSVREETSGLIRNSGIHRSPEELAGFLSHHDQRVRLAAQFALSKGGESNLPMLVMLAENTTAPRLARIHALWAAGQLAENVPAALNHLPALLRDRDSEVRTQAARLLGDGFRFEAFQSLAVALRDPAPRVALFAAQSLGKLKRKEAIPLLIEALRQSEGDDAALRHAIVVAMARLGPDAALEKTIHDPSRAVRLGGLLAYRRLGDAAVASFLDDFDPYVVREAALAINDTPIEPGLPALAAKLDNTPLDDGATMMRAINAQFLLGTPESARALAAFASRAYVPIALRAEAIERLAEWANPPNRDRVTGQHRTDPARNSEPAREALREFLAGLAGQTPQEIQIATINAVSALKMPGTGHALWDVVFQEAHPVPARIAALRALEHLADARLEVAAQHAGRSRHGELRRASLDVLARQHPAVSLPILKEVAQREDTEDLRAVFRILSRIDDPRADEILVDALQRLRKGRLPRAAEAELLDATAARAAPAVSGLLAQIKAEDGGHGDGLVRYRSALEGGDAAAGKMLFERDARLGCVRCHDPVESPTEGISAFPREKKVEDALALLDVIVNSHARMSPGFDRNAVTSKNGKADTAVRSDQAEATIRARADLAVSKDHETSRRISRCAMPRGAGEVLTRTELRDLFAYVLHLDQRPSFFSNASLHSNRID